MVDSSSEPSSADAAVKLLELHGYLTKLDPHRALDKEGRLSKSIFRAAIKIAEFAGEYCKVTQIYIWRNNRSVSGIPNIRLISDNYSKSVNISRKEFRKIAAAFETLEIEFYRSGAPELGKQHEALPVGGIIFLAPTFTEIDRIHLTLIGQTISQVIVMANSLASAVSVAAFENALLKIVAKENRAGTVISDATLKLWRMAGADVAYYCSLIESSAFMEYRVDRGSRPALRIENSRVLPPKSVSLRAALAAAILDHPVFYWTEGDADFAPLSDSAAFSSKTLVIPVRSLEDVVGFFVCEYHEERPGIEINHAMTLAVAMPILAESFAHLYQRRSSQMIIDPIYRGRDTKIVEGQCCTLMPFTETWSERVWKRAVRPAISDAGYTPMRADDMYGHDVMEDIWNMILKSEVVIADITNRNANVFYELGIAHALGKRVILMTQSVGDIPFDLNRYRHVIYEDNVDGFEYLQDSLKKYLNEARNSRISAERQA